MPLYEFECSQCGEVFEEICDAAAMTAVCAKCGAADARRLIGKPAPLKTGAFPFKVGPVHPMANKMDMGGSCSPGGCASCGQE